MNTYIVERKIIEFVELIQYKASLGVIMMLDSGNNERPQHAFAYSESGQFAHPNILTRSHIEYCSPL